MATILDQIVETKRTEIAAAKQQVSESELRDRIAQLPPTLDFAHALQTGPGRVRLIAEVKKASPSAGLIRADFDPQQLALAYERGGASCISVLTDQTYFQGHLSFLTAIRAVVKLPLLRKDFIVDPYQLLEARAAGADCVLLIAECLTPAQLMELHQAAWQLGLQTLIELYDSENIAPVLATGTRLIGVNNRDLRTFVTDLQHTIRLRQLIPADRILVGESGIASHADVDQLASAGVQAMLVGESLMRQPDLQLATEQLIWGPDA